MATIPIVAANLIAKVSADTGSAESAITHFAGSFGSLKGGVVVGGLAIGAAVLGIGVAATKMAGDFQAGMTSLVTGAGESEANIKAVSDGILKMAVDTGTPTKQLTDGMYMIESAGYHGKAGLDVLKAAAEGAKVGNAQLADVANGVTTEMTDFSKSGLTAAQATNMLIATVANGKTHMTDLANSMASILPTASAVGVHLVDVQGAMATMTGEGVPAAQAATYLRQTLMALDAPSKQTKTALEGVGLSATTVAGDLQKSLPDTLKMITDAVGKKFPVGSAAYVEALKQIAGGSKQMQGILDLTGDHMSTLTGNVKSISDAVKKGGNDITGWALVQDNFNQKMARAGEIVETLGIKLGTALLPIAGRLVDFLSNNVIPGIEHFATTFDKPSKAISAFATVINADALNILKQLTTFVTGTALPAVQQFGTWFSANLTPILTMVAGIITTDVVPAVLSIAKFIMTTVIPAAQQFATWFGKNVMPVLKTLADVIANNVIPAVESVASTILTKFLPPVEKLIGKVLPVLIPIFNLVGWVLQHVIAPVLNVVITVLGWLIDKLADVIGAIGNVLNWFGQMKDGIAKHIADIWNTVTGWVTNIQKNFDDLASKALTFGTNFIQKIIDGIEGMLGNLASAAGKIGDTIDNATKNVPILGGIIDTVTNHPNGQKIPAPVNNIWAGPKHASGTSNAPGGMSLVGENGPELVNLPRGAQVYTASQTSGMFSNQQSFVNGATGNANAQGTPLVLEIDGQRIGHVLLPFQVDGIRRALGVRTA